MKAQSTPKSSGKGTVLHRIARFGLLRSYGISAALVILAALLLLKFGILHGIQDSSMTSSQSGKNASATDEASMGTVESHRGAPHGRRDFVYPSKVQRDPFERQTEDKMNTDGVISDNGETLPFLKAVIWRTEDPIAILEDEDQHSFLVRVNWWINSCKVAVISPTGVVLERDGEQYELKLWQAEERQPWSSLSPEKEM